MNLLEILDKAKCGMIIMGMDGHASGSQGQKLATTRVFLKYLNLISNT